MGAQSTVNPYANMVEPVDIGDPGATSLSAAAIVAGNAPAEKPSAGPVSADQAVFTSIRSATAGGYRIIAASSGLTQPERQEITQRCPSHASLTDGGESAEALFTWQLRSGRHAVAWSRHAGVEHTGRGGFRVHTHVAVLDDAAYRKFECHPMRVYTAMLEALPTEPYMESVPALEMLLLPDPGADYHTWISAIGIGCRREVIFALLDTVLAGKSPAAMGVSSPFAVVDGVLAMLPMSQRSEFSLSIGLKPSPSRPSRMMLLDGDAEEAHRLTHGMKLSWLDLAEMGATPANETGWMGLVRRWWGDGRRGNLCRLVERMTFAVDRGGLDRIAAICRDVDALQSGDSSTLEQMAARYSAFRPANEFEAELVDTAREAISAWSAE